MKKVRVMLLKKNRIKRLKMHEETKKLSQLMATHLGSAEVAGHVDIQILQPS